MQSKHRKQMSQSEIEYAEMLVHAVDDWKFDVGHLFERMMEKGIRKKDAALALKFGEVIRVQSDGRVVMRLTEADEPDCLIGTCVCADLKRHQLITVWYNEPDDTHSTLNLSKYRWKRNTTDFLRSI